MALQQTLKPWDRQPAEPSRAYSAFVAYLEQGPDRRSLTRLGKTLPRRLPTLKTWSSKYEWVARAALYDTEILRAAMEKRQESRERIRQKLIDRADEYLHVIDQIISGEIDPGELDKYGQPLIKVSTRLQAAQRALELAGLVVPKRYELAGPDGSELQLSIRSALGQLTAEQLTALAEAFSANGETEDHTESAV